MPSRGLSVFVTAEKTIESPKRQTVAPAAWRARSPVSMSHLSPANVDGDSGGIIHYCFYLSADKDRKAHVPGKMAHS